MILTGENNNIPPTPNQVEQFLKELKVMQYPFIAFYSFFKSYKRSMKPHKNVIKYYGMGNEPTLFTVTEYCNKGSLYTLLHKNETLSWEIKLHVMIG